MRIKGQPPGGRREKVEEKTRILGAKSRIKYGRKMRPAELYKQALCGMEKKQGHGGEKKNILDEKLLGTFKEEKSNQPLT